jgi:hypothetical protein
MYRLLQLKYSLQSNIIEFRPQLQNGKDLTTPVFREILNARDFKLVTKAANIAGEGKYWQEIGEIDTKGARRTSRYG